MSHVPRNKHSREKKYSGRQREGSRSFTPEGKPQIGLWGKGIISDPQEPGPRIQGDLVQGAISLGSDEAPLRGATPESGLPLTGGAKERPPAA